MLNWRTDFTEKDYTKRLVSEIERLEAERDQLIEAHSTSFSAGWYAGYKSGRSAGYREGLNFNSAGLDDEC